MHICNIDLIFTFVDELLHDQTPESVHLMPQGKNWLNVRQNWIFLTHLDEIWVEHRFSSDLYPESDEVEGNTTSSKDIDGLSQSTFCDQMRGLLASGAHSDVVFLVGPGEDFEVCYDTSNVANSIPSSSSSSTSSALVESIPAHRAVLAARSEYFTAMFRGIIFLTMRWMIRR